MYIRTAKKKRTVFFLSLLINERRKQHHISQYSQKKLALSKCSSIFSQSMTDKAVSLSYPNVQLSARNV